MIRRNGPGIPLRHHSGPRFSDPFHDLATGDVVRFQSLKMGVNYGLNRGWFPSPVIVDSRVRLKTCVKDIQEIGNNGLKITFGCEVEQENSDKPACVCDLIALMFE